MDASIEYTAQAVSPLVSGEVKMTISEKALTAAALFDIAEIPFAEMNALIHADYTVTVKADDGDYVFSRMGNWRQPFFDALLGAYNGAVLRSLFIKSDPIITARGNYRFIENGVISEGASSIHVYENSVAALPPDISARRIPLCAVIGMDKGDHELTLKLNTGESYTFAKLGYDTAPFAEAVEKQIRFLRGQAASAVKEIDPTLTAAQVSQIVKLAPQGAAAAFGQLAEIAPSFTSALEEKLSSTRAAESYAVFKELCDPTQIYIGFRKNETTSEDQDEEPTDPYLLWLIAPSPDGRYAAVEFAEADAATFVYRTGGDFISFAHQLSRALEAIDFKREVIRLSDKELRDPDNADYYMASKRTAALRFIRSNFVGRVIHSSAEAWKNKLIGMWG